MLSKETQKQPSRGVLGKGVLKICSKFTAEHPYRNVISNLTFFPSLFQKKKKKKKPEKNNKQTNICNRFKKCKICFLDFLEEQAVLESMLESLFNKEHLQTTAPDADSDHFVMFQVNEYL